MDFFKFLVMILCFLYLSSLIKELTDLVEEALLYVQLKHREQFLSGLDDRKEFIISSVTSSLV
jgi:hypothetical protein